MQVLIEYVANWRHRVVLEHDHSVVLGLIHHDLSTGELWRAWKIQRDGSELALGIFEEMSDAEAAIIAATKRQAL